MNPCAHLTLLLRRRCESAPSSCWSTLWCSKQATSLSTIRWRTARVCARAAITLPPRALMHSALCARAGVLTLRACAAGCARWAGVFRSRRAARTPGAEPAGAAADGGGVGAGERRARTASLALDGGMLTRSCAGPQTIMDMVTQRASSSLTQSTAVLLLTNIVQRCGLHARCHRRCAHNADWCRADGASSWTRSCPR
jgi:hypothetical protein